MRKVVVRALRAALATGPECGAVLCLIGAVWWGIWATLDNQRVYALDAAARDTANLARAFEENTSRIVAGADQILLSLRSAYVRRGAGFDLSAWVKREVPADWVNAQIALIPADGISLGSTASPDRVYIGDREHFIVQRNSTTDDLFISKPVLGRSSGRWTVQLTRKIVLADGSFGGIVVFSLDCYRLSRYYQSLNLQQGYIAVAGLDGIIRARGPVDNGFIGAPLDERIRSLLQQESGTIRPASGLHDVTTLTYRRLQYYPLVVMVAFADKQVLASYRKTRLNMLASGAVATILLLTVGTVWVILRRRANRSQRALTVTLENMNQGLVMIDEDQRVRVVNKRALQLLGLPTSILGSARSVRWRQHREASDVIRQALTSCPQRRAGRNAAASSADEPVVECNRSPLPDGGGIHVLTDVTARHMADQRIRYIALHDSLTGLANRILFADEGDRHVHASEATRAPFAMLCLDLNRFKSVNDTFGHDTGDELLTEVARRLKLVTGETDLVARVGGDEFAILCVSADQPQAANALAARIVDQLNEPFTVTGQQLRTGACIGIAIYPEHGSSRLELAKAADLALYAAKQDRTNPVRIFDPSMSEALRDKLRLESDLRAALATDAIYPEFQPVFATSTLAVVGFEALARWNHPTRGRIRPDIFIPMAEETGLIVPLGSKILEHACRAALAWPDHIRIAVNLSPIQFRDPNLVATISGLLASTGLPARRLELEVTEGVLIQDEQQALETLTAFRALGVSLALDDFGTGYSSLSYLRKFPFDRVKVDRSFVQAQVQEKRARYILESLLGLGRNLGLSIVAEGVETRTQLHLLREQGCQDIQGFLVGRPMTAADALQFVPKPPAGGARGTPLNTFALTEP